MAKLKIAVLGARSIGKFHVREFVKAGADVTAILGSSQETAAQAAEDLHAAFGIRPRAYAELDKIIEAEHLDAVSICTPPHMHYAQVKKCLEAGLHVFCEKPLVLNSDADNYREAKELVALSERQGKILTINTQWTSILDHIKDHVDLSRLTSFSMQTQPESLGINMLTEQLSHSNSIVVKLLPGGRVEELKITTHSQEVIDVYFTYVNKDMECAVHYNYTHKADRPRKVLFSFNGTEFRREVGENYEQRFVTGKTVFGIEDPFRISIAKFVGAMEGSNAPLVSSNEMIENVALQDRIIAEYKIGH